MGQYAISNTHFIHTSLELQYLTSTQNHWQ